MSKSWLYLLVIYTFVSVVTINISCAQTSDDGRNSFIAPPYKHRLYYTRTNIPIVKIMINGQGPYNFLLDTGSPETILSNKIVHELAIAYDNSEYNADTVSGNVILQGLSGINLGFVGSNYQTRIESPLTLTKQSASLQHSANTTQIKQLFQIADGLLGLNAFCNTVIKIDGPEKTLTVYQYKFVSRQQNPRNCFYKTKNKATRPVFKAKMKGTDVNVFADTGDRGSRAIIFNSSIKNDILWEKTTNYFGMVMNKYSSGKLMKITGIRNVDFGPESANADLVVLLADPVEDSSPFTSYFSGVTNREIDAHAGWEILKKGILTIDINRPQDATFRVPRSFKQDYNKSGISKFKFNSTTSIEVVEIAKNSPADMAGMKVGDIITRINDTRFSNNNVFWLFDILDGKKGSIMIVEFTRKNKKMRKNIFLSDYIFEPVR